MRELNVVSSLARAGLGLAVAAWIVGVSACSSDPDTVRAEGVGDSATDVGADSGIPIPSVPNTSKPREPDEPAFDPKASELCSARLQTEVDASRSTGAAPDPRYQLKLQLLGAFDSTVDEVIAWYQALLEQEARERGGEVPAMFAQRGEEIRARYSQSADDYEAVCWIEGNYPTPGLNSSSGLRRSVVLVRSDGTADPLLVTTAESQPVVRPKV